MMHLANILIVTDDAALGADLLRKFNNNRYQAQIVFSQGSALAEAARDVPDIVLIGPRVKDGDPLTLARALKSHGETADIPVCFVTDAITAELQKSAYDAGVADVLLQPISENKLIARLRPLVRLSAMQVELMQRGATAKKFGVSMPSLAGLGHSGERDKVLFIGKDVDAFVKQFPNADLVTAPDPYQAENHLESKNFDVAIASIDGDVTPYLDLCVQIRNNPRLFNLPLIVVADMAQIDEETAYQHGVSGYFQRPADPFELHNMALFLMRRQRHRWAIREGLAAAQNPAVLDEATRVFSRGFADNYIVQRVNLALKLKRPLSIGFFRVPDVEQIRIRFGEDQANHLRLQVSQWITRLLRAEDVTARYGENEFCVLLPDSPESEASLVISRIAGVLAYTDFAVRDVYEAVKVWVRVGSAELKDGDTAESLISRARSAMVE
jgi:two-component system cell cycle response regulator